MRELSSPEALGADLDALGPCVLSPEEMALCRDANDVLAQALSRADRWEAAARGRYAATLAQARRTGHEAGIAAASAEVAALTDALHALEGRQEARATQIAGDVVRTLFNGLDDATRIAAAAQRALADNPRAGGGRLAVAPCDLPEVSDQMAETGSDVVSDPSLARGVARLETVLGTIHLSVERQLAQAMALLRAPPPQTVTGALDNDEVAQERPVQETSP